MTTDQGLTADRIVRYTLAERMVHWTAGIAFVYLLVTGLAFFTPALYWLSALVGGGPTARFWHPWIGLMFTLALVAMYGWWRRDMRFTETDRAWSKAVWHYVRNEDEKVPPAGRFNAGQKQFFWATVVSGALLLASGVVLWIPDRIPSELRIFREAAVLVHSLAALVSIGGFIIHVYMGAAVVRGSMSSIVHGDVSRSWAEAHHPQWLREKCPPESR